MGAKKKRRTFTPEFKAEVVLRVQTGGQRLAQVAWELGLSESSVRAWVNKAEADANASAAHDNPPPALSVLEELRALAPTIEVGPVAALAAVEEEVCDPAFAPTVSVAPVPVAPRVSLPPTPAVVEAPARPSTFRLIEAQARMPQRLAHRPPTARRAPAAVPQAPTTLRRVALLAGAAVPLLVVGFLFLSRPAEGEPAAVTAPTAAAASEAPAMVASAETHYVARFPPPTMAAPSSAPAPAPVPAPAVSTPPTPPTTVGTIVTSTRSHDHRIFVDGRTAGVTGETIEVRCGYHRVRYGSEGRLQDIDVPCGGQVTLEPSWGSAVRAPETEEEIYPTGESQ